VRAGLNCGWRFYDWQETIPGIVALTLAMSWGTGMAAMLMAMRAAIHAVTQQNRPAAALQLAERPFD
jgi:hypothetical protein